MAIWQYDVNRLAAGLDSVADHYVTMRNLRECAFCNEPLRVLVDSRPERAVISVYQRIANSRPRYEHINRWTKPKPRAANARGPLDGTTQPFEAHLKVCPACGWWTAFRESLDLTGSIHAIVTYGGIGALTVFDLSNVDAPMEEIRQYLVAKYDERFQIAPRIFEEVVASVFRDLGYSARVTAYSGDDGIDVVLDGPKADGPIGVQVKRYKDKIHVSQLRELTGALVINGMTRGIFVTTSEFQSGGARTAAKSGAHGYPIELYDAKRFYEALRIAQRASEHTVDTTLEHHRHALDHEVLRQFDWGAQPFR